MRADGDAVVISEACVLLLWRRGKPAGTLIQSSEYLLVESLISGLLKRRYRFSERHVGMFATELFQRVH